MPGRSIEFEVLLDDLRTALEDLYGDRLVLYGSQSKTEQFVLTEEDARTTLRDAEAVVERTSELLHDESQAPVTSNL